MESKLELQRKEEARILKSVQETTGLMSVEELAKVVFILGHLIVSLFAY